MQNTSLSVKLKKTFLKGNNFQKKLLFIPSKVRSYNPLLFIVQYSTVTGFHSQRQWAVPFRKVSISILHT